MAPCPNVRAPMLVVPPKVRLSTLQTMLNASARALIVRLPRFSRISSFMALAPPLNWLPFTTRFEFKVLRGHLHLFGPEILLQLPLCSSSFFYSLCTLSLYIYIYVFPHLFLVSNLTFFLELKPTKNASVWLVS